MESTAVALGCSQDADYEFLIPMTSLLWRDHIGFRPIVYLVGTFEEWSAGRHAVVLQALRDHGIERRFIQRLDGYPYSTVAQNIRQHVPADPAIPAEEWVMPADADLFPLRREFYQAHVGFGGKAVLYYANGDHFKGKAETLAKAARRARYQSIPTCHVTMRAETWRELYGYQTSDSAAEMQATLDAWLKPRMSVPWMDTAKDVWMSDQRILTERLCAAPWFPETRVDDKDRNDCFDDGAVRFVTRRGHPAEDRLDRQPSRIRDWDPPYDPARWVDAHVFKSPFGEPWALILPLIEAHLPRHAVWARKYREEYVSHV